MWRATKRFQSAELRSHCTANDLPLLRADAKSKAATPLPARAPGPPNLHLRARTQNAERGVGRGTPRARGNSGNAPIAHLGARTNHETADHEPQRPRDGCCPNPRAMWLRLELASLGGPVGARIGAAGWWSVSFCYLYSSRLPCREARKRAPTKSLPHAA